MAMKVAYAVGVLAEFAETLRLMAKENEAIQDVEFHFEAAIVIFTHNGTKEFYRLEPGVNGGDEYLIRFPLSSLRYCVASSREKFWELVKARYHDLSFPELQEC